MPPTPPTAPWPIPVFNLRVDDLSHEGAKLFFANIHPLDALREAVLASFTILYTPETVPKSVEEIELILRPMEGVAYTHGSTTHKEIHFSLDWIKSNAHRAKDEIMGVLTHEVVHCFQYNAQGTCPGGLIEGIADYVRLRASLAPSHWHRGVPGDKQTWDLGYDTTAYFLDWINTRYGANTIRALNLSFQKHEYHRRIFRQLTGRPVRKLWALYRGSFSTTPKNGIQRVFKPDPPAESESEDEGFDRVHPTSRIPGT